LPPISCFIFGHTESPWSICQAIAAERISNTDVRRSLIRRYQQGPSPGNEQASQRDVANPNAQLVIRTFASHLVFCSCPVGALTPSAPQGCVLAVRKARKVSGTPQQCAVRRAGRLHYCPNRIDRTRRSK
jgi:hypothetical protein